MPFATLALTFRAVAFGSLSSKQRAVINWQHGCIETLGARCSELLLAHCFLEANRNCAAGALHDATRKKTALFYEAEKDMQLLHVAIVPPDLAQSSRTPTDSHIRYCHTRLLGVMALTIPYPELKNFFNQHYFRNRPSPTAGLSFKSVLLEFSQARYHSIPVYKVVEDSGADHAKNFEVEVTVGKVPSVAASGTSKKRAEEAAAEKWLRTNAHALLLRRTVESAHVQKSKLSGFSSDRVVDLDFRMMRALRQFKLSDNCGFWLQRALTHPSLRAARRLPEYEDNHTTAVFGSYILQTGFSHYLAARHFSSEHFELQDASLPLMYSKAASAEALGPIADRLGIMRHVRMGPQTSMESLNNTQRASFLQSLTAVRFLAQSPNFDVELSLGPDLISHFDQVISSAKSAEDLKSPLSRLLEFAACQAVRVEIEEPIASGPSHQADFVARIKFTNEASRHSLVVRGGRGSSGRAARQTLAKVLLPVLSAIHHDFGTARQVSSVDLVDKLAVVFLPAAFAAAPHDVAEAEKWRALGLLGSKLLSAGEFTSFSLWAGEAARYVQQAGLKLQELESNALGFYQFIDNRRAWDVRSVAQAVVASVKLFAKSTDALTKIRSLKQQSFFVQMQELLRVLNLAAKAKHQQTTIRDAFDGLALLRRRDFPLRYTFDGPELAIDERDGATIELCSEILEALSISVDRPEVQVLIQTTAKNDKASVVIRRISDERSLCRSDERLNSSLLISFLKADGFIEAIRAEANAVTCVFPQGRANDFERKAREAVESPFSALAEEPRAALSKLLHDLKNHLIGAEIAVAATPSSRTLALRAQAEASEHLDAACRLADQFALLSGVLGETTITEVSVSEFFRRCCARLFADLPPSIALGVPGGSENASVWTSEQFLDSIIDNLVRNSVEAMNSQGTLNLAWDVLKDTGSLVVNIRDTGPGIPPDVLQRLVDGQSVSSTKTGGTGVGMLTVVSMLRRLGGKITGTSSPTCGTNWTICIPSLRPSTPNEDVVPNEPANLSTE
jgi:dsRNA-specific ribonuclease/nitrogen-specific signal transduction histidine kinase